MESLLKRSEDLPNNLRLRNLFSKIKGRIHYVLELGIEFIELLVLTHPYFLKTGSELLELGVFNSFCALLGILKNSLGFLVIVSGRDLLEFFIGDYTKQSIQCSTIKVCNFDLGIIPCYWLLFSFLPTYFNYKLYFLI